MMSGTEEKSRSVERGEYVSNLFESFCHTQERVGREGRILDLGPSMPPNVIFWASRGHPVTAQDVLGRHDRGESVRRLDLPDRSYSGVLCWTILAHLGQEEALALMGEVERVILPGGCVFAIFDGSGLDRPPASRYRIRSRNRLAFEPLDRDPPRAVTTSQIERLLKSFRPSRLTVMRHGSREALGTYPKARPAGSGEEA